MKKKIVSSLDTEKKKKKTINMLALYRTVNGLFNDYFLLVLISLSYV